MTRKHNWEQILADFIASKKDAVFEWGSTDCCLFACDAVLAITGEDIAHDFRGKYTTVKEACVLIKDFAGGGLDELATKRAAEAGMDEVPVNFAGRGDVVLVDNEGHDALGIVGMDGRSALCASAKGLVRISRTSWKKAWKV